MLLLPKDLSERLLSANHGSESKLNDQHQPVLFPQRRMDNTSSITIAVRILDSRGMPRYARTKQGFEARSDTLNFPKGSISSRRNLNPEVTAVVNQKTGLDGSLFRRGFHAVPRRAGIEDLLPPCYGLNSTEPYRTPLFVLHRRCDSVGFSRVPCHSMGYPHGDKIRVWVARFRP